MVTCLAQVCESNVSLLSKPDILLGFLWFSLRFERNQDMSLTTNSMESVCNSRRIKVEYFPILAYFHKEGKRGSWDQYAVCLPVITFEPVGRFSWNVAGKPCHWKWPQRVTFNSLLSTVPKWGTFKLLRWRQSLHQSPLDPVWTSWIQSIFQHPISSRSILISLSHLRLGLPNGLVS
jgi:hypothetical protein